MKCPNCGNKIRTMGATDVVPDTKNRLTNQDTCINVMFHCDACGSDYKVDLLLPSDIELSPVYWG